MIALGFTGERMGAVDGTVYLRARHYQPTLGRFLQRDTFPGIIDRPQSLNRYPYARNNPVNWIDPSGNDIPPSEEIAGGAPRGGAGQGLGGGAEGSGRGGWAGSVGEVVPANVRSTPVNPKPTNLYDPLPGSLSRLTERVPGAGRPSPRLGAGTRGADEPWASECEFRQIAGGAGPSARMEELLRALRAGQRSIRVGSRSEAEALAREFVGDAAESMLDRRTGEQVGWINRETGRTARFPETHGQGQHINVRQLLPDERRGWTQAGAPNVHIEFPD